MPEGGDDVFGVWIEMGGAVGLRDCNASLAMTGWLRLASAIHVATKVFSVKILKI